MKNIILIAAPSAGKGTQSKLICEKYNLVHISTGDLLRESLKDNTEISRKIKEDMALGNLINDEIILDLIENRLIKKDIINGFVLDGFPRNINQAEEFNKLLIKLNMNLDNVFYLDIDKVLAKKRIIGRLSCSNCNSVYNNQIDGLIPKVENVCDKCGNLLFHRSDDNDEIFEKRYYNYETETKPLLNFYKNLGLLTIIDSSKSFTQVFLDICNVMGDVLD